MKIAVLVDSFKNSISSKTIVEIFKQVYKEHEIKGKYISDGGEGLISAFSDYYNGEFYHLETSDSFGENITASFLVVDQTAFIEMSACVGIELVKEEDLNPFKASTYGLGRIILDAIDRGVKTVVLGIGGSTSNDGAAGVLQSLGVEFFDKNDCLITEPMNNLLLGKVMRIDKDKLNEKLAEVNIVLVSDVTSPLLGENGATYMFSRQKGAKDSDFLILENNLTNFASILESGKENFVGAGSGGGLGYGLSSVLGAEIKSGIDFVIDNTGVDSVIKDSDLIFIGEGKIDEQTFYGKAPSGILRRAEMYNKKVIAICGACDLTKDQLDDLNIPIYSITPNFANVKESINNTKPHLINLLNHIRIMEKI